MLGKQNSEVVSIQISTKQILRIIIVVLLLLISLRLIHVFLLIFLSFIVMASIRPAALLIHSKLKIPKPLAVVFVYISLLCIVTLLIYTISKPFSVQFARLIENFPSIVNAVLTRFPALNASDSIDPISSASNSLLNSLSQEFSNIGQAFANALDITLGAFNILLESITVLIISIYLFLERENILNFIQKISNSDESVFYAGYERIETQIGAWVRGQLLLGLIVGFATYLGLSILGVSYALPLAVLAGILEIVPFIGPLIAAIPIVLLGFSVSPITGLLSLGLTILIQQLENHLLVPTIMNKAVGLSPVVTIISILIGSSLLGILGSIIAVPIAAMCSVFLQLYIEHKNRDIKK